MIECRINAEDPANNFAPAPGTVTAWQPPSGDGIRVDTHVEAGYVVPPFYDSLLAKVIVTGRDRADAIARMIAALSAFQVAGVPTTIPMHIAILEQRGVPRRPLRHALDSRLAARVPSGRSRTARTSATPGRT